MRLGRYRIQWARGVPCRECGHRERLEWRFHRCDVDHSWRWVLFAGPVVVESWHDAALLRKVIEGEK